MFNQVVNHVCHQGQGQAIVLTLEDAAELIDTGKAVEYGRVRSRLRLNKLNAAAMEDAAATETAVGVAAQQAAREPGTSAKEMSGSKGSKCIPKVEPASKCDGKQGSKGAKDAKGIDAKDKRKDVKDAKSKDVKDAHKSKGAKHAKQKEATGVKAAGNATHAAKVSRRRIPAQEAEAEAVHE